MKIYEIRVQHYEGEPLNLFKLKCDLQKRINSDPEIMEQTQRSNLELAEKLKKFCENPENAIYAGTAVRKYIAETPCFSYIKGIEYNGKMYDLEINSLSRTAELVEVD